MTLVGEPPNAPTIYIAINGGGIVLEIVSAK
jgi:hypothetical protein